MEQLLGMADKMDYAAALKFIATYGGKLLVAVLIFIIGKWVSGKVRMGVQAVLTRSKVDATLVSFAGNIVQTLILVFVVIAALGQVGVQTASLAAMIAAIGLAIGMALQGSLSNVAAGVLLIVFRPFKVGDVIDAAGTGGVVDDVSIFTTRLVTPDNRVITVPNASITSGNITNISAREMRRLDLTIHVAYEENLGVVHKLAMEVMTGEPLVLSDPAPAVHVEELTDEGVKVGLYPWVKTADYLAARTAVLQTLKTRFDGEKVSLLQRDTLLVEKD